MKKALAGVLSIAALAISAPAVIADQPPGQLGYEGQPGNQGGGGALASRRDSSATRASLVTRAAPSPTAAEQPSNTLIGSNGRLRRGAPLASSVGPVDYSGPPR